MESDSDDPDNELEQFEMDSYSDIYESVAASAASLASDVAPVWLSPRVGDLKFCHPTSHASECYQVCSIFLPYLFFSDSFYETFQLRVA